MYKRDGYTAIIIDNPTKVYLNKDRGGSGNKSGNTNNGYRFEVDGIDVYKGDEVVINGLLFEPGGETTGGYIHNGKIDKNFVDPHTKGGNFYHTGIPDAAARNGVIGQVNGNMFLMSYGDWDRAITSGQIKISDVDWAFQNGPIMQQEGKAFDKRNDIGNPHNPASPNENIRTAVGFNKNGGLVIIYTDRPATLYELGEFLEREGATNGIYLDGVNVGYVDDLRLRGDIVDGSHTLHIQTGLQ